jgi:hemerythrin superfamily protein
MNSHLLTCGKFEIPDALTLDHEELRTELIKAAIEPGRIGIAAKRVAHFYLPHFAREEQMIFSAFGLLQDLAAERVLPDMAPVAPMIALFSAQHRVLLDPHQSINAAVEELLQEARKEKKTEIADLVYKLRNHEKIEDEVMYPTVLLIGRSVRDALGIELHGA